jgi:hypothetical protein
VLLINGFNGPPLGRLAGPVKTGKTMKLLHPTLFLYCYILRRKKTLWLEKILKEESKNLVS